MPDNKIVPIEPPELIKQLANHAGGTIDECALLPDGSGFATMSMPLPKDHWLFAESGDYDAPPMSLRDVWLHGEEAQTLRSTLADKIRAGAKYAIRASTMNGKAIDFGPDAMVQNMIVGLLGYWTHDGLSTDAWANPAHLREKDSR